MGFLSGVLCSQPELENRPVSIVPDYYTEVAQSGVISERAFSMKMIKSICIQLNRGLNSRGFASEL